MDPVQKHLGEVDKDGVWHVGRGSPGCKHCGHVELTWATNGKLVWHRPGSTCCRKAVEDQLRWRRGDVQRLRDEHTKYVQDMEDNERLAETGEKFDPATKEAARVGKNMRKGYPARLQAWRLQTDGDGRDEVGLKGEIKELEQMLASFPPAGPTKAQPAPDFFEERRTR